MATENMGRNHPPYIALSLIIVAVAISAVLLMALFGTLERDYRQLLPHGTFVDALARH